MAKKDKRFYWIKLKQSLLTSEKVDFLMSQKNGAQYVVLYQCLCLKTINSSGELANKVGELIIPFDELKIERECKWFDIDTIRIAMGLYKKLGLIYEQENGILKITEFEELVGSETYWAGQKRIERATKKSVGQLLDNIQLPLISNSLTSKSSNNINILNNNIDIEKENIKEKESCSTPFDRFIEKYSISCDNYSAVIGEMDFDLLDKAFSESKWLQLNFTCLSKICKKYKEIIGGAYKDFVKPKNEEPTQSDAEFLIEKGFSKEYVMFLSVEQQKEKREKWDRLSGEIW